MRKLGNGMIRSNPVIRWLLTSFFAVTSMVGIIACYFAYQQKLGEVLSELDKRLFQVAEEYKDITEDFWAIYLPVFEEQNDNVYLSTYFTKKDSGELSPVERFHITKVLSNMAARDEKVQWIALYSPLREVNYIYSPLTESMQALPSDFPYLENLTKKTKRMDIYASEKIQIGELYYESIAITGGVPGNAENGSIIVGYDTGILKQLCEEDSGFSSLHFNIFLKDKLLFTSDDERDWSGQELETGRSGVYCVEGERWYVQVLEEQLRGEHILYAVKWEELFWRASQNAGFIIVIMVLTIVVFFVVYMLILRSLAKEVNRIQYGLDVLGQNKLDYRIQGQFYQPELSVIAESINQMSVNLKENIERAHEYEQKQREAELQEQQAKFNPHFLYNTLEMFRVRCYQNGDEETAELIAQTASIFRGFIGPKTFIQMQEELAFSKRYLALFKARYGESVRVLYDIDTEVLEYGIIRNAFLPLIENYFEHGYNPDNQENYIMFRGCIRDEETILFTIEDNGFGMDKEALEELNHRLQQPITSEKESYGLRNLHQRLRLFYGGECGLTLCAAKGSGMVIKMVILRKKC